MASEYSNPRVRGAVSKEEWEVREDLAALFRVCAWNKWDHGVNTYITARVPGEPDHMLVNPQIEFNEITASSLIKIDKKGEPTIDGGFPHFTFEAMLFNAPMYQAAPSIVCIAHLHINVCIAVATQKQGLRPISQFAIALGKIAYHEYDGVARGITPDQAYGFAKDITAAEANVMMLRNHGVVVQGDSVSSVYGRLNLLVKACEIQVMAMAGGADLVVPSELAIQQARPPAEGGKPIKYQNKRTHVWKNIRKKLDQTEPDYRD